MLNFVNGGCCDKSGYYRRIITSNYRRHIRPSNPIPMSNSLWCCVGLSLVIAIRFLCDLTDWLQEQGQGFCCILYHPESEVGRSYTGHDRKDARARVLQCLRLNIFFKVTMHVVCVVFIIPVKMGHYRLDGIFQIKT